MKASFFFTSLFLPFVRNYALDLVQKVMNEIWLESSQTCHAHDSSTETSNPNRTCCTLPNMPLYQLTPFMWLRVWFILTASIISQPYGVWFFSSKCRRTSSQREGWVLALRAGEAEIKDAWNSTHPPEDHQNGSIFSRKLSSRYFWGRSWTPSICRCSPHTHPSESHSQAAKERIAGVHYQYPSVGLCR